MELTKKQIERQDFVDDNIWWCINELFVDVQPHNRQGIIHWNIEDIAKIRDFIYENVLKDLGVSEMEFYPYMRIK